MIWPFQSRSRTLTPPDSPNGESYVGVSFEVDGAPGFWLVNEALIGFAETSAYPWQLTIAVEISEVHAGVGLPTNAEQVVLGKLTNKLSQKLKANRNALFVASSTAQGLRQLFFRVRDPEVAHRYVTDAFADPAAARPMEYRMENDPAWALADPYLEAVARRAADATTASAAATPIMASALRSTSASVVAHEMTEIRMAVRPCHTVMPAQHVPST